MINENERFLNDLFTVFKKHNKFCFIDENRFAVTEAPAEMLEKMQAQVAGEECDCPGCGGATVH